MDILDVEKNKCIGCGACISIDSEHFDFDEEGLSQVISNDNLKKPELQDAIESCPTGAIRLAKSNECYDGVINESEDIPINQTVYAYKKNEVA